MLKNYMMMKLNMMMRLTRMMKKNTRERRDMMMNGLELLQINNNKKIKQTNKYVLKHLLLTGDLRKEGQSEKEEEGPKEGGTDE